MKTEIESVTLKMDGKEFRALKLIAATWIKTPIHDNSTEYSDIETEKEATKLSELILSARNP